MATHVVTGVTVSDSEVTGGTSVTATADGQVCVRRSGSVTFDALAVGDVSGAASTSYVDSVAQGLDVKASVRAATTANITLSGAQTIDGVSVVAGDRVLVKNQTTGANNGIYLAASGSWTRATDADASAEVTAGLFVFVSEGTVNGNTGWTLTTDDPITLGTTALTFTQFSGAGTYTAGTGLTLTGTSFALTSGVATPGTYAAVTVDTYGRVTAGTAAAALTKTDDTNVTLTLGGSPTTALVNAASITVGWSGTLGVTRGGTGLATFAAGDVLYASASNTLAALAANATATRKFLRQVSGAAPAWDQPAASDVTGGAALTKVDDTNVTLTLGGTPTACLLVAASLTLGWTGTLGESRGGTGNASYTKGDLLAASGATTLARVAVGATDGDVLSADSTAAAGVSYQHPALQLFAYRVPGSLSRAGNRWYGPARLKAVTPGAAVAAAANKIYAQPFFVPAGQTIYQAAVKQASFSIGGNFRVGIYGAASVGDPWPLGLLWDSGAQSTGGGSLTNMLPFTANLATTRGGMYWFVFVTDNATATYEPVSPGDVFPVFGCPVTGGASGGIVRSDFTYAALPAFFPTANRTILGSGDADIPCLYGQFKSPYLLYETFSDVDATALTAHVMDYGGGWTNQAGTWTISGGKAVQSDTTGGIKVITANAGTGDLTYEVDIPTPGSTDFTVGAALRFLDLNNWWRVVGSTATGNWRLIEHTASAGGTVRATYAVTPTINTTHHIKAVLSGTSITVYIDGVSALTFTSSAQQTNTLFGLYESRSAGLQPGSFDNMKVY